MNTNDLAIMPVETRDLPWISALLQKMVDIILSPFVSPEQVDAIVTKQCSQEALINEMEAGYHFVKLMVDGEITGFASYRLLEDKFEAHVDKLYALPGDYEQFTIITLVNYIREQMRQGGYNLLTLTIPLAEQQKIELFTHQGFIVGGLEKVEISEGFQIDAYRLTAPLSNVSTL